MIELNNTEIAFKTKSNKDLKRAKLLFKLVASPISVKLGKALTNFALFLRLPVKGIIKRTIFRQFCGGETITESQSVIDTLGDQNVKTILDYSIEGKESTEDFEKTTNEIIATIERGKNDGNIPFAVFKVTGIARHSILEKANDSDANLGEGEIEELQGVISRIDRICNAAYSNDIPLFIDAEETWFQDIIDRIVTIMMVKYNGKKAIVFNTIQMYRHDRLAFLERSIQAAREANYFLGIKLVRGAYMEKERERAQKMGYESPIQKDKDATDKDFDAGLELMIKNVDVVSFCAGTHNEKSSIMLTDLMKQHDIPVNDDRIYFAQLLGMSDHISFNLAFNKYNVAKYVPYGPVREVIPYLIRRAEENTSVAGQTGRELSLILQELNRRKN